MCEIESLPVRHTARLQRIAFLFALNPFGDNARADLGGDLQQRMNKLLLDQTAVDLANQ